MAEAHAHQAQDFDLFAVNTAELQRYIDAKLVQPIDTAAIPNHARLLPRFRNAASIPGLQHAGQTYAVPYTYSEMGLIYDRQQVHAPPTPSARYGTPLPRQGVVVQRRHAQFSLASQAMGDATPFASTPRNGLLRWTS